MSKCFLLSFIFWDSITIIIHQISRQWQDANYRILWSITYAYFSFGCWNIATPFSGTPCSFHVLLLLSRGGGGVPGGVLDRELLHAWDELGSGGIHTKHTLLRLGPKFIPPQFIHGGVGGGVHRDDSLIFGELNVVDETSKVTSDGWTISEMLSLSADSMHSHEFKLHSGQPYKTSRSESTFSFNFLFSIFASFNSFTFSCSSCSHLF